MVVVVVGAERQSPGGEVGGGTWRGVDSEAWELGGLGGVGGGGRIGGVGVEVVAEVGFAGGVFRE